MKIEQKRREMELKVKYVRAEAVEKTFAEAEAASRSDLCFTHSTPNTKPTEENTPKHPQDRKPGSSHSALVNDTPQFSAPIRQTSIPAGQSWAPSVIPNSSLSAAKHPDVTDTRWLMTLAYTSSHWWRHFTKAELVTFDGNPLEYWSFIRAFENTVGQETIGDGAKLTRLLQYCKGKARQLLQCCAVKGPSEGYALAVRLLKERFGDEHTISQSWIDKVTERPIVNDNAALQDLADDLRCCRETLNTMGYLNELNNRGSLLSIIEKLPYHLKTRWLKEVHRIKTIKKRTPNIDDVTKFITTAAEEVRDPVFGKIVQRSSIKKELKLKDTKRNNGRANFGIQTSSTKTPDVKPSVGTPTKTATPCPCCGQLHYLNPCDAFKAMRIKDRFAFVISYVQSRDVARSIASICTFHFHAVTPVVHRRAINLRLMVLQAHRRQQPQIAQLWYATSLGPAWVRLPCQLFLSRSGHTGVSSL